MMRNIDEGAPARARRHLARVGLFTVAIAMTYMLASSRLAVFLAGAGLLTQREASILLAGMLIAGTSVYAAMRLGAWVAAHRGEPHAPGAVVTLVSSAVLAATVIAAVLLHVALS